MHKSKLEILAFVILFLAMVCLFTGISFSIFTYFGQGLTNNVIETGRVVFSYSDSNGGGNGIHIEDALPTLDEQGKLLSSSNEYFDFSVSATATNSALAYEITVLKDPASTLEEDWLKVYLTTFEGNQEVSTSLTNPNGVVATYHQLMNTSNPLLEGKTIYYGTVNPGEVNYGRKFRLRMWIKVPEQLDFDYSTLANKYFSLKVNVAASTVY